MKKSEAAGPVWTGYEISVWHLIDYFYTYRKFIVSATVAVTLIATTFFLLKEATFRSSIYVNIDFSRSENQFRPKSLAALADDSPSNRISLIEQYFTSPEIHSLMIGVLADTTDTSITTADRELINQALAANKRDAEEKKLEWIIARLEIKPAADRNRLEITSTSDNAQLSAALANLGARCLVTLNHFVLIKEIITLRDFLRTQTSSTKDELRALEAKLATEQNRARIISVDDMMQKINSLEADDRLKQTVLRRQSAATAHQIEQTQADLSHLKSALQEDSFVSPLYIDQVQRRLEILRYEKSRSLSARSPASIVELSTLDTEISSARMDLNKQLSGEQPVAISNWDNVKKLETSLFELRQKHSNIQSEIAGYLASSTDEDRTFASSVRQFRQITDLKRNIDLTASLYTSLRVREQDVSIREAAHSNDLVIIAPAVVPKKASGMGALRSITLSSITGFTMALILLFIRYSARPMIRGENDLAALNMEPLGVIPKISTGKSKLIREDDVDGRVVYALDLARMRLERALALANVRGGQTGHVLVISSALPFEGRTFFAVNMAESWAAKNRSVCLIDFNFDGKLRGDFFRSARKVGAENEISKGVFLSEYRHADGFTLFEGRSTMKRVCPDSFASKEFTGWVDKLRTKFDVILIDAPQAKYHAETVVLIQGCDAVITVVNQRSTPIEELASYLHLIDSTAVVLKFSVLNFALEDFRHRALKAA